VIDSLRRKPRAFLDCTWQQELLPNDHWRQLWQTLSQQMDREAAGRLMVEALYIAATQDKEAAVADYLDSQLPLKTLTLTALQKQFQLLPAADLPALDVHQHELSPYDQLLTPAPIQSAVSAVETKPQPQKRASSSAPPALQPLDNLASTHPRAVVQTPPFVPYAAPLVGARTAGDATPVVLRPVLAGSLRIGGGPSLSSAHQAGSQRGPTPDWKKLFQL
jgi:hypothetical protein